MAGGGHPPQQPRPFLLLEDLKAAGVKQQPRHPDRKLSPLLRSKVHVFHLGLWAVRGSELFPKLAAFGLHCKWKHKSEEEGTVG